MSASKDQAKIPPFSRKSSGSGKDAQIASNSEDEVEGMFICFPQVYCFDCSDYRGGFDYLFLESEILVGPEGSNVGQFCCYKMAMIPFPFDWACNLYLNSGCTTT
jgi:hypothetical protein